MADIQHNYFDDDNLIVDDVYAEQLSTYIYQAGQHRAMKMHASAIHDLGGITHLFIDRENFSIELTPDFEKKSSKYRYYELLHWQEDQARDIQRSFKSPVSAFRRAISLAMLGGIGSCSYNVAPKSTSELDSWGTFFAAWGAATIASSLHKQIIGAPNEQKMLETAASILNANQRIIRDWRANEPSNRPA